MQCEFAAAVVATFSPDYSSAFDALLAHPKSTAECKKMRTRGKESHQGVIVVCSQPDRFGVQTKAT